MSQLTLTIKKSYFDQIAAGTKKIEYRRLTSYYARVFSKAYKTVVFHYYKSHRLQCDVIKISKVKKPARFKNSAYLTGNIVWAIHLKNPITFIKEKVRDD